MLKNKLRMLALNWFVQKTAYYSRTESHRTLPEMDVDFWNNKLLVTVIRYILYPYDL